MAAPTSTLEPQRPTGRPRRRRWIWFTVGIAAVLLLVIGIVVGFGARLFHPREGRAIPAFPSLAAQPDDALHGTVAYYANDTGCIRLVAAAGRPSKDLWCLPAEGPSTWQTLGKPVGPQLVWRADGRLEVTMFRMKPSGPTAKSSPGLTPGWQKIVDPRTGAVEDVPAAQAPAAPNTTSQPTVNAKGERVGYTFDPPSGRAKVTLTDAAGTRTLLSVHGPGEYTYSFGPVFWAPNGEWIAATDDGRILVITPADPPVTRVLVTDSGGGAGGGTAGPAFSVTAENLLASTK